LEDEAGSEKDGEVDGEGHDGAEGPPDSQAGSYDRAAVANGGVRTPGLEGVLRGVADLSDVMGGVAEVYPMLRAFR